MFCKNCGRQLEDHAKFCDECGSMTEQTNTQESTYVQSSASGTNPVQQGAGQTGIFPQKTKKKTGIVIGAIIAAIALILVVVFFVLGSSPLSIDDVKEGHLLGYPSKNIGEAFEGYFNNCTWDAFQAADDDAVSVVQVAGYTSTSDGDQVKVLVQFTHDADLDEENAFNIYIVELTSKSQSTYLDDDELEDMLDAVYYGGGFSWSW